MPQITADIISTKDNRSKTISLNVTYVKNNQRESKIKTVQNSDAIGNTMDLAKFIVHQEPPRTAPNATLTKRLIIDYSIEEQTGEDGEVIEVKVIDNVDPNPLPERVARDDFKELPLFANDLQGIADWINNNVTADESVKQALEQIANACYYLQVQLKNGKD